MNFRLPTTKEEERYFNIVHAIERASLYYIETERIRKAQKPYSVIRLFQHLRESPLQYGGLERISGCVIITEAKE